MHLKITTSVKDNYFGSNFRKLSSSAKSTKLSIGLIINGIADKPIAVTNHLRAFFGSALDFFNPKLQKAHNLFIVNPGIITDASSCQTNVSVVVKTTLRM